MTIQILHPKKAFFTIPLLNEEYDYVKLGMAGFETFLKMLVLRIHKDAHQAALSAVEDSQEDRNPYRGEEGDKLHLIGLERLFYYIYKKIDALHLPERKTRWILDVIFHTPETTVNDVETARGIWTLTGELEDYVDIASLINLQLVPQDSEKPITPSNTHLH